MKTKQRGTNHISFNSVDLFHYLSSQKIAERYNQERNKEMSIAGVAKANHIPKLTPGLLGNSL